MSENEVLFVRSSKKNGNKSTEGESSTNEDDIWDDTILIEAYDKAVQLAKQSCMKKKQSSQNVNKGKKKGNESHKWKVGDKCKCQYSEDMKFYEADVIEILSSTGMCVVKYVGYENEERVPLKALKPSEGEEARVRQCEEALNENETEDNMTSQGNKSESVQKKSVSKKKDGHSKLKNGFSDKNSMKFPLPHMANAIIPPPPPPHMFNSLNDDENETEAMSAMLISWYMSGYHTGYYQGLQMAKKQS